MTPRIFGSLTAADPAALGAAADRLIAHGVDGIHLDLGDGHFVPFLTFGVELVVALRRRLPTVVLDVHLMVDDPERYLVAIAAAHVDRIAFHAESTHYPARVTAVARQHGISAVGIALNPGSPLSIVPAHRSGLAFVNLLTTEPDQAGECLLDGSAERVAGLRSIVGSDLPVMVDGGVTSANAGRLVAAGASELVVGRALAGSDDPASFLRAIRTSPA